jgi:hypothetical protein
MKKRLYRKSIISCHLKALKGAAGTTTLHLSNQLLPVRPPSPADRRLALRQISHATHDFGSILKFSDEVYGLPSRGYTDALADDLSDCFDFSQTPITFQTIGSTLLTSS